MNEENLKLKLLNKLSNDFYIHEEVEGKHALYNKEVRIDFLLKAKEHLISSGFTDQWFGVECKWIEGENKQTSKVTKLFWQSITYSQSEFVIKNEKINPLFVAVFVTEHLHPRIQSHFKSLSQLALYGNVGELFFYNDGHWGIKFTYNYARSDNNGFTINSKKIPKIRAGSL